MQRWREDRRRRHEAGLLKMAGFQNLIRYWPPQVMGLPFFIIAQSILGGTEDLRFALVLSSKTDPKFGWGKMLVVK